MRKMLKKLCFVAALCVVCFSGVSQAGQISSAGYTNNIANFDGYTNVIDGGRWSYLDEAYAPYTSNGVMGTQFTPGVDWAAAAPSVSAWRVQNNGAIFTDNRGTAFNYTFDAADANTGWARITGTYGGPGGHRLIINKVADSSLTTIDSGQTVTLLDQSSENVIAFDITTSIAAGNDITFVGVDNLYWWEPYTLDATITAIPEPATLGLLGLGGLFLSLRRSRRR